MPLYQYVCKSCNTEYEKIQKFGQEDTVCSNCGNVVSKLLSTSTLKFCGSGFYTNDYASHNMAGDE